MSDAESNIDNTEIVDEAVSDDNENVELSCEEKLVLNKSTNILSNIPTAICLKQKAELVPLN